MIIYYIFYNRAYQYGIQINKFEQNPRNQIHDFYWVYMHLIINYISKRLKIKNFILDL